MPILGHLSLLNWLVFEPQNEASLCFNYSIKIESADHTLYNPITKINAFIPSRLLF